MTFWFGASRSFNPHIHHEQVIMPSRNSVLLGAPLLVDLMSSDVERAHDSTARYLAVSLSLTDRSKVDTSIVPKDGHRVAVLMANRSEMQSPDNWAT